MCVSVCDESVNGRVDEFCVFVCERERERERERETDFPILALNKVNNAFVSLEVINY